MNSSLTVFFGLLCLLGVARADVPIEKARDFVNFYDEGTTKGDGELSIDEFEKAVNGEGIKDINKANIQQIFTAIAGDDKISPAELQAWCNKNKGSGLYTAVANFNKKR